MDWSAKKIKNVDGWFDDSDPFLRFFKNIDDEGIDYEQVHETEWIKDCPNPVWKNFKIKA